MCGIVGYIGRREATEFLVEGLRRLEYRGYDSSGIATIDATGQLGVTKAAGRIDKLVSKLVEMPLTGSIGIGHTRWATHGRPNDVNAHPHFGGDGSIAVVHNGVIENYQQIKDRLEAEGYQFLSTTDSEVIGHLISSRLALQETAQSNGSAESPSLAARYKQHVDAITESLAQLRGTYGIEILFQDHPEVLFAARRGSPMVLGVGEGGHYLASDPSPMAGHADRIMYLSDHEIAIITQDAMEVIHRDQGHVHRDLLELEIGESDVDKQGFEHHMLKEIFEQPESLRNAMRGRLSTDDATAVFGGLNLDPQRLSHIDRIVLTGCGTSWHAALVGEYLLEDLARIPVEVEYASELRYRNPPTDRQTLVFAITQSGETADTLAALREMKRKGHPTLAICNVVGSTIAQESDGGIYLYAGPEVGVASTKAFTSQVVTLAMLALYFGRLRHLSFDAGMRIIEELTQLPDQVEKALETDSLVQKIAQKYCNHDNFLYLGRQYNFPTALEGALKLKEISYIHAEGYPAAEMKHGPIALVDEKTPSVFLLPKGFVYDKVMSNLEEIKARGGAVIAIVNEGDTRVSGLADDVIEVPEVPEFLQPIVTSIPLQLLSYHIAVLRGCDVDRPRNLAKSVTVE